MKVDFAKARALYPSCEMGVDEWLEFFNSPAGTRAMGRVFYDIFNEVKSAEERRAGIRRVGRRPGRKPVPLDDVMAVVFIPEWNHQPFALAVIDLIERSGKSRKEICTAVPMSEAMLSRLLGGSRPPTMAMLEGLADALGVKPWYFVEWRAMWIGQLFEEVLTQRPHLGITAVKTLRGVRRRVEGA